MEEMLLNSGWIVIHPRWIMDELLCLKENSWLVTDISLWIKDNLKDQTLLIKDELLLSKESLLSYNGGFVFFDVMEN